MAVLEIYLEILTNFFEILHPPLNPNKTDAGIELRLNNIEEKLLSCTEIKHTFCNLSSIVK